MAKSHSTRHYRVRLFNSLVCSGMGGFFIGLLLFVFLMVVHSNYVRLSAVLMLLPVAAFSLTWVLLNILLRKIWVLSLDENHITLPLSRREIELSEITRLGVGVIRINLNDIFFLGIQQKNGKTHWINLTCLTDHHGDIIAPLTKNTGFHPERCAMTALSRMVTMYYGVCRFRFPKRERQTLSV